jgi:hypothetical protein
MLSSLKRISAGISLGLLALGFLSLGILSFLHRAQGESAIPSDLEENCCFAGSAVSVFAGAIFFVAAWIYWSRWPLEPAAAQEDPGISDVTSPQESRGSRRDKIIAG